jgi:peptidoglycan-associated lipoprotein
VKSKILQSIFLVSLGLLVLSSCAKKDVKTDAPMPMASQEAPPPALPVDEQNDLETVHFDYDSAKLTSTAKKILHQNATWLKKKENSKVTIKVEGHCDERGSEEYNIKLGDKRAEAVKHYLVSHGIRSKRMTMESFGKDRPMDAGHDEEAWAKNRRCAFRILSK